MTRRLLLLCLLVGAAPLAACGRQGPLRLPDETPRPERPTPPEAEDGET
jgi:predicted small lipoprotein YifL